MAERITFTTNGLTYQWVGGFGAVIKSYERGVRPGDVRHIHGDLFYAYQVYANNLWSRCEVSWTLQDVSYEKIQAFRQSVFGA